MSETNDEKRKFLDQFEQKLDQLRAKLNKLRSIEQFRAWLGTVGDDKRKEIASELDLHEDALTSSNAEVVRTRLRVGIWQMRRAAQAFRAQLTPANDKNVATSP